MPSSVNEFDVSAKARADRYLLHTNECKNLVERTYRVLYAVKGIKINFPNIQKTPINAKIYQIPLKLQMSSRRMA